MKCGYLIIILALFVMGCNNVTGDAVVELEKDVINDGDETSIHIDFGNTGDIAGEIVVKIIPEDEEKIIIDYPGELEFELQPLESIGTKIIKLKGFTDYSSTKYWVKIQFINKADNKVIEEIIEYVTVEKEI